MKHTHTPKTHKKNPKHQNRGSAHKPTHTGRAHSGHGKDQEILTGFIKTNRQKTGYVDILETDTHVYFPTHNINTALHGDEVTYIITDKIDARRKLPVGKVVSIVERASTRIVGTAVRQGEKWFVSPDDKRIYTDIFIPEPKNMEEHKKVLVSIEWKPKAEYPEGTLLEVIGTAGDNDTEMKSILLEKGFDHQFPPDVEREAAEISKLKRNVADSEWSFRKDFKNKTTFTIDPADAKDFDDALSIETLPNGHIEVGVHIADVAFFVTPGSALDKEAQKREFSVYLVDRTIPMLPEVLSNDLCSLNPNEEKRAFSALFEIDMEGKVYSREFTRSVIKSNKRFAYEEAQATIDDTSAQYYTELKTLNDIAHKLRKAKALAGAIDFETDEIAFTLDAKGVPLEIHKKQRLDAHKLIEEFMLLANREVAMFIGKEAKGDKSKESLYRIHDVPNKERIEDLTLFLKALGYDLESKDGVVTNKGLQHILKKIEHTPQEALIKTAILRSMAKATYNITNIGHFGLAFDFYTHFTSPIRR